MPTSQRLNKWLGQTPIAWDHLIKICNRLWRLSKPNRPERPAIGNLICLKPHRTSLYMLIYAAHCKYLPFRKSDIFSSHCRTSTICQGTPHSTPFWDWGALLQLCQLDLPELSLPREAFSFQQWRRVPGFTKTIFANGNRNYHPLSVHGSIQCSCLMHEQDITR